VGTVGTGGQSYVHPVIDQAGRPGSSAERDSRLRQLIAVPVRAGLAADLDRAYARFEDKDDEVKHLLGAGTAVVVSYVLDTP
jgi:hypothetical protein